MAQEDNNMGEKNENEKKKCENCHTERNNLN